MVEALCLQKARGLDPADLLLAALGGVVAVICAITIICRVAAGPSAPAPAGEQ
jgi:hypothetical protein